LTRKLVHRKLGHNFLRSKSLMDQPAVIYSEAEFEELLSKASERERVKRREEAERNSQKCADLKAPE
jgi:hypothetical protein